MASSQSIVDFILDQIIEAGNVSAKKMFGEYGVYCDGKIVALICDNQLFVKPTIGGKAFIGAFKEGSPYPGAKPYLFILEEAWENSQWLTKLIQITAAELPISKKQNKKKSSH